MSVKPENLQHVSSTCESQTDEHALRYAVIDHYIGQTTIALRRNALVVDASDEKRREEDDEAHSAITVS